MRMNWNRLGVSLAGLVLGAAAARADVTLLLEDPYGDFGGMNPTGHAAIYLSTICAASPLSLRRCGEGEQGVVISRYHLIAGHDWIAIPVVPYLYAVNQAEEVPPEVDEKDVASLRDDYRRRYLEDLAPDESDGSAPAGSGPNWSAQATTGPSTPLESKPRRRRTTSSFKPSTPNRIKRSLIFYFIIARTSCGRPSTSTIRKPFIGASAPTLAS